MDVLVNFFVSVFKLITDNSILGMPIFVWLVLPALIGIILKFIQGKR